MNKKVQPDDALAGIRKKIGGLQGDISTLNTVLAKPSIWAKIWEERNWSIPVILIITGAIGTALWYVGSLILDSHVRSGVAVADGPMQADIRRIDGDVQQIKAMIRVLQAQIAAQNYATVPPKELKTHSEELTQLRATLAQLPPTSPGYWPAAFQIITLASKATSEAEGTASERESIIDNVSSNPIGGFGPVENRRVVLKNLIQGMIFKNSIVRFDPSVRLVNDVFINCVFIFPAVQIPPQPLQEIGKALLASDLSKVTLNAS